MVADMLGRFSRTRQGPEADGSADGSLAVLPAIDGEARREPTLAPTPAREANQTKSAQASATQASDRYLATKVALHRHLIDQINLGVLDRIGREELAGEIRPFVREYVREQSVVVNARELEQLVSDVADEMLGLGPIEPLLKDDNVTDVLINTHRQVYIERFGQLELTPIRFKDEAHLIRIINKIVSAVGRRVDESAPMVDARLPDGSRFNAAIKPVAVDGPLVSIRKFSRHPYSLEKLLEFGSIRPAMIELVTAAVQGRISVLVSGGTGSGKTTMLNALSAHISHKERLVTIEDAAELQLQQPHVGRLETRPPNVEGRGEIRQRELVKNALRMRPDRIIVGEVRGEEAFDMLQAMNTGHEGSMTTIHANAPRDALSRLEQMVGMAGMPMDQRSIRGQIASAIRLVIQVQRLSDGGRRIISISEITGMEGDVVQMQEIFKFVKKAVDEDGRIVGEFRATGIRPRFLDEIAALGFHVSRESFDPSRAL
ncbi:CpaF family protein [Microbaculum marinisediminis]|uniref:CpaF family protein n=1 Tax=Microbaculum marinisediminis TaxID=2931392 RepID=A0AAW5QZY2_9HYPH|nr:CpaF family protein [Microbaculum sp. A6E488]MCT8972697.1 CpaF family protein [Microbaculum sp. A6E488]